MNRVLGCLVCVALVALFGVGCGSNKGRSELPSEVKPAPKGGPKAAGNGQGAKHGIPKPPAR